MFKKILILFSHYLKQKCGRIVYEIVCFHKNPMIRLRYKRLNHQLFFCKMWPWRTMFPMLANTCRTFFSSDILASLQCLGIKKSSFIPFQSIKTWHFICMVYNHEYSLNSSVEHGEIQAKIGN